ncbi:branched-chain amino acid ABC transporter permease [Herbaspirillum huttiense]|uniref:Branched-chain amino acid ABC transporter permease n=2 Tax=Herbaspirillum huttiense TaxID=863372 RepID=A0AAJ2HEP7_9BURK|nr:MULTISPECIES: branched-chain amino acid ABC transporter permease [Herbaspirillum]MBP1316795.1 branched-chain amino acid transport system permease protein [Herbaspirillum sp. 1130]MCO4855721.1 branched-chain amino acid ABC transporter permease [Herbaspirillum sp. WGmk3]MCP3657612.1 branched-chain amino acid ABC transporter permease [Herbaspirillum sp.]MCP3949784.1 branched-chain amino acid ABC transporter permease [Herbaspirillum sp.]MCP4035035.1 branched-chain amino acid ABC transporter per
MGNLIFEQVLNSLQFGVMLFLIASGLTLIFGVMNFVNLAHGSFFMIGAYVAAVVAGASGSFWLGLLVALPATAALGFLLEWLVFRRLYKKDHMVHVLATFAFILIFNDGVRMIWGPQPLPLNMPPAFAGPVNLFGLPYSSYRLLVMAVGVVVAVALYFLINRTRIGMWVRAGANNLEMVTAMGINIRLLFRLVFSFGLLLAALAGIMLGPLVAVQAGMGDDVLILAFVVVVIGGIGSVPGAAIGALIVGVVDTLGRSLLPQLFALFLSADAAASVGPALGSMMIYLVMIAVLFWRPSGLFPART